jgi:hypothetical protein
MDLARADKTDPHRKMRRMKRRLDGTMYKTVIWFEWYGAERIPQKSIKIMRSAYKKTIAEYWRTLDPTYMEKAQCMRMYTKPDDDNH